MKRNDKQRTGKGERHRRPAERAVDTRFFNTYWQLRKRLGPCGCASYAPSTPHRRGRVCGILDSWLRSDRRSGRRVAGTQHAVATPFLRARKYRKQAHAAHGGREPTQRIPPQSCEPEAQDRQGTEQNDWPVRVKAPINRRHHKLLLCTGNSCRVCLVGTLWYRALAGFPVGQVRLKRIEITKQKKKTKFSLFRGILTSPFNNDPFIAAIYSLLIKRKIIFYILFCFWSVFV